MSKERWINIRQCPEHRGVWSLSIDDAEDSPTEGVRIAPRGPLCRCGAVRIWAGAKLSPESCTRLIGVLEGIRSELSECAE